MNPDRDEELTFHYEDGSVATMSIADFDVGNGGIITSADYDSTAWGTPISIGGGSISTADSGCWTAISPSISIHSGALDDIKEELKKEILDEIAKKYVITPLDE